MGLKANINMKKSDFLPNTPLCCNKSNWFHRFCPILGGLFSPLPNDNDHQTTDPQEIAFRYAVDKINADNKILPRSKLHAEIERIMPQDSFHASKRVCHLMKTGVAAIFGPQSSHTASHVQSICDTMEVSCNLIHLNIHFLFWNITGKYEAQKMSNAACGTASAPSEKKKFLLVTGRRMAMEPFCRMINPERI